MFAPREGEFYRLLDYLRAEPSRLGIEHFFCHNSACPDHGKRGQGNVYFRGWSGRDKQIRMAYCRTCKRSGVLPDLWSTQNGSPSQHGS